MPRFVLDTTFTVPGLPTIPVYGFSDTFTRPNAPTLGVTSGESKAWRILTAGATVTAGIENNCLYAYRSGASTLAVAVVDAGLSDGTFRAKVAAIGDNIGGIVLRVGSDPNSSLTLNTRFAAGNNRYLLNQVINGVATQLGFSAAMSATGDLVEVVLSGTSVIVRINGITQITATTTILTGTSHGFNINIGTTIRWDDASFHDA